MVSRDIQMISARRLQRSTTGMLHQFRPITELQEMQYPRNAVFNFVICEVQLACDIRIRQSLSHQTIDGKKYAQSPPKSTHCAPAFSKQFMSCLVEKNPVFWRGDIPGLVAPSGVIQPSHRLNDRRCGLTKTGQQCTVKRTAVFGHMKPNLRVTAKSCDCEPNVRPRRPRIWCRFTHTNCPKQKLFKSDHKSLFRHGYDVGCSPALVPGGGWLIRCC